MVRANVLYSMGSSGQIASLAKQAKTDILTLYRSACLKQVRTIFLEREKISLEPILDLMCEWGEKNMDERFELTNPQYMQ